MILGKQMFQLSLQDFDIKNIFSQILAFENEHMTKAVPVNAVPGREAAMDFQKFDIIYTFKHNITAFIIAGAMLLCNIVRFRLYILFNPFTSRPPCSMINPY